ncbi:MAG TPA: hypothetical protein VNO30_41460 [Kofleriaceae bacterium]|nr:hypothetical protein [Kofleriaceae bacterium]
MAEVRIELLEVHFDVVGEGEQEFARLFERYINRWTRIQNERDARDRAFERDRVVGDRRYGGQ